mgnify:CR=1 FL=1
MNRQSSRDDTRADGRVKRRRDHTFSQGDPVWYYPVLDEPHRLPGVVTTAGWQLGHGTTVWHVNVWTTGAMRRVCAVSAEFLEPRDEVLPTPDEQARTRPKHVANWAESLMQRLAAEPPDATVTINDLLLLRRALGVSHLRPRKVWGYRNRYCVPQATEALERLQAAGLMTTADGKSWRATPAGGALVGIPLTAIVEMAEEVGP